MRACMRRWKAGGFGNRYTRWLPHPNTKTEHIWRFLDATSRKLILLIMLHEHSEAWCFVLVMCVPFVFAHMSTFQHFSNSFPRGSQDVEAFHRCAPAALHSTGRPEVEDTRPRAYKPYGRGRNATEHRNLADAHLLKLCSILQGPRGNPLNITPQNPWGASGEGDKELRGNPEKDAQKVKTGCSQELLLWALGPPAPGAPCPGVQH